MAPVQPLPVNKTLSLSDALTALRIMSLMKHTCTSIHVVWNRFVRYLPGFLPEVCRLSGREGGGGVCVSIERKHLTRYVLLQELQRPAHKITTST